MAGGGKMSVSNGGPNLKGKEDLSSKGLQAVSLKYLGFSGKDIYIEDILPKAIGSNLIETPEGTSHNLLSTVFSKIQKAYVLEKKDKLSFVVSIFHGKSTKGEDARYMSFSENDIFILRKVSSEEKQEYLNNM
jgi:hypothetical protein